MKLRSKLFNSARLYLVSTALIAGMAVSRAAWAQDYSFSSIVVDGNKRIETATIQTYAGIETGKTVSAGDLNTAYQQILASGLFETVDLTPRGGKLVITVKEYPTVNQIAFEGNVLLNDDVLRSIVVSRPRLIFTPEKAETDRAAIAKAYADSGRLAARITPKIIRKSDNRVDLVFEIFEGGLAEIAKIGFVGNKTYSDRRLRRVLGTKQAGLFRIFVQSDTLIEDRIEFDKQLLSDFYQSRGFVDFRVNSVNAELAQEQDGYFLNFNIREGQRFNFGEISVSSDRSDVDTAIFQEALNIDPGDVYSPTTLENNITRLETRASQLGLDFVRVTPRVTRNDRDLTLDIDFVIERGERVFVERIDISGNTSTLDKVVRRQFRLSEGDPFNPREIRAAAERIRALGFFTDANVRAREGSSPDNVVVDVKVDEKPTGSLSFGATYSVSEGGGVLVEYKERNFLGRGQQLNLTVNSATDNRKYEFQFSEPSFLHDNLRFDLDLFYKTTQNQNAAYDTQSGFFQPSLSFPLSENLRLGVRAAAAFSELKNPGTIGDVITAEVNQGRVNNSSVGYTLSYDTRLTNLDDTSGFLLQLSQDFGGLDGENKNIKSTARAIAQKKIFNEEITLRSTLEAGLLSYSSGDSRVTDRFFMGPSTMRGFRPSGIGPRETSGAINDALGGNKFAVARFEAEFPVGLPAEYGISGGVFYDVGNLWSVNSNDTDILYSSGSWRHVAGASIFWTTPIGPLRFNFTRALKKEALDEEQKFDLTISTKF
jgi:outer membrane protein insertion porin family